MSQHTAVSHRRFALADTTSSVQLAALIGIGAVTAVLSAYVKLGLGIGGHAIVLTAFPTMLGVSAFPRRLAGTTVAVSAIATAFLLRAGGAALVGPSALTAFAATGLLTDVVLARASSGWKIYAGLVIAGLVANLAAFGAHLLESLVRVGVSSATPWPVQVASYAACGAAAGFACAAIAFQLRARR